MLLIYDEILFIEGFSKVFALISGTLYIRLSKLHDIIVLNHTSKTSINQVY